MGHVSIARVFLAALAVRLGHMVRTVFFFNMRVEFRGGLMGALWWNPPQCESLGSTFVRPTMPTS